MADVFISYHEKSAGELAEQIADALDAAGISSWCARRDLPPGSNFARDIPPQIDVCRVFLLLLNNNVYQSLDVENELGMAFERLKKREAITILPFEMETVTRKEWLRYYLFHIQNANIPLSHEQRIPKLITLVAKILNKEPQFVQPSANIIQRGECGENITYTLDDNGLLIISGSGKMWDYGWQMYKEDFIYAPWWNKCEAITHVRINSGVTSIGKCSFYKCTNLIAVTIPDGIISIKDDAFAGCGKLNNINIPNSVVRIGAYAFSYCSTLSNIIIPDSVTFIGVCAFYDCYYLKSVSVPERAVIK